MRNLAMLISFVPLISASIEPPEQPYAVKFGSNSFIATSDLTLFDLGSDFTVESWIYLEWPSGIVASKIREPFVPQYEIQVNEDGVRFIVTAIDSQQFHSVGAGAIPLHEWVHIAATLSNSTLSIYIDGELRNEAPGPPSLQPSADFPFSIGGYPDLGDVLNASTSLYGLVREVRLWDRALGADELAVMASMSLQGNEDGLIADWRIDAGEGQLVTDRGPGGYNLVLGLDDTVDEMDPHWAPTSMVANGPFYRYEQIQIDPPAGTPFFEGNGGAAIDLEADGDADIVISQLGPDIPPNSTFRPLYALRNDGTGILSDATAEVFGEAKVSHSLDEEVYDFNGDGRDDILFIDHGIDLSPWPGEQNRIFVQDGAGNLVDESWRLPQERLFSTTVSRNDIDQDGDSDLFFGGCPCDDSEPPESSPRVPAIYVNQGNNNFLRDSVRVPDPPTNIWGSAFLDVDRDGDQDLIIADGSPFPTGSAAGDRDPLYLNEGDGNFVLTADLIPQRSGAPDWCTTDLAAEDLNVDGWPDVTLMLQRECGGKLFTSQYQLLLNDRSGSFVDISDRIDQSWPDPDRPLGNTIIASTDINDDGWPDILSRTGLRNRLHVNFGDAFFRDMTFVLPRTFTSVGVIPGDINGDYLTDYVVSSEGQVHIYHSQRPLDVASIPAPTRTDTQLLGDLNGNGFSEIATLTWSFAEQRSQIGIHDGATGSTLRSLTPLSSNWIGQRLVGEAADTLGFLAVKRNGTIRALVIDSATGRTLNNLPFFSDQWTPVNMVSLSEDGLSALALLATKQDGTMAVEVRDTITGAKLNRLSYFNDAWTAIDIAVVPDISGNGQVEIAVLAKNADRRLKVVVKDRATGQTVAKTAVLSKPWWPYRLDVMPDINGNTSPELAVMAERDNGQITVQIKDLATGEKLNNVPFFSKTWEPRDFEILPDLDGNGVPEIALLARDQDSANVVQVRDALTDNQISKTQYASKGWYSYGVSAVTNEPASPDLAVMLGKVGDGSVKIQMRNAETGALSANISVP